MTGLKSGFQKAQRKKAKLKIAVTGPSGSGKTYSALLIAKGLGGKIALLDTETGSGSLYAGLPNMPEYDTLEMHAPFHTDKYIDAIREAVKGGYDVLVIDSITHQWAGEGGIIDRKDKEQMAKPTMNSYTLWAKYTPEHERFKQSIVQAPIHIIATARSKQDYILVENEKGKSVPRKVGMAPVQREALEYEFTTVFDLSMEHYATVSKDRTHLFDGQSFRPTLETGEKLLQWMNSAQETRKSDPSWDASFDQEQKPVEWRATKEDLEALVNLAKQKDWTNPQLVGFMKLRFGKDRLSVFTKEEHHILVDVVSAFTFAEAEDRYRQYLNGMNKKLETDGAKEAI